jgi:hypothetical protein
MISEDSGIAINIYYGDDRDGIVEEAGGGSV